MPNNLFKLIGAALLGLLVMVMFFATYFTVDQNERTVVTSWGKFSYVAEPGLHFKMPFRDSIKDYATDIHSFSTDKPINTFTADNQEVDIVFTVQYRVPPDAKVIEWIFNNNRNFENNARNMVVDRVKVAMGLMNTQTIAAQRGQLRDRIFQMISEDIKKEQQLEITDFQLTDLQFTPEYRKAINQAAIAKASVEQREYDRQAAVKEAERVKATAIGEADKARESARGMADSTMLNAKANADARILQATAEAKAIQMQGEATAAAIKAQAEALKTNETLVEMEKAKRWDGKLPTSIYAGAPIPFMQAK
jgi:regulator of protease activity HflC (stomatin/prohibitin superfamily)